jgi:hypothetical protein
VGVLRRQHLRSHVLGQLGCLEFSAQVFTTSPTFGFDINWSCAAAMERFIPLA